MSAPEEPAPGPEGSDRTTRRVLIALGVGAVVLPCVGATIALALPRFVGYFAREKTQEATRQLETLYEGAAAYYAREHVGAGGEPLRRCVVPSARVEHLPLAEPAPVGDWPESFAALGVTPSEPLYYRYTIESAGGCGHPPGRPLYTFRAEGNLDGDDDLSTYELTASSASGELVRGPALRRQDPLE